ncbi:hypothetical protein E2562_010247 [Oryza meyeriana var. granulata]|uniref:BED-type domain-containing protein n=1 Tax=Oryza meyeriana var. granulata TaxID=110450 RepID=A0A6G1EIJ2_9ORYZ|nr:hypothetical protein E2562_010247 [Oryza meyeriana var. granulata]
MASPPSIGSEYDPKNDLARKQRKSTDPRWKYAYWPDLGNKDEVACTLCGGSVRGGIKRLKQHLVGGFGDAKICPKVGTDLRREMAAYLEANKRRRPLFLEAEDVEAEVVEVSANGASVSVNGAAPVNEPQQSESSQAAKVQPSSGTASKRRQATIPKAVGNKSAQQKATKSIVEMLRKTPEEMTDERLSAAARQFQIAVEATTQFGSGYKPPTPYQLGEPLLNDAVKSTIDGYEKPAMPEVQALMNHAKEKIKLSFAIQTKRRLLEKIMKIIEQCWEKQMDHPLYGAALYLNPGKLHPLIRKDDDVPAQGCRGCECDLTWDLVDEAVGASQSLHGRTFPRRAHNKRARNSIPTTVQEELGSENEEEEEIQDPYDDADVTDCEDDHNDANGGGEEEAANILGEFDDGY